MKTSKLSRFLCVGVGRFRSKNSTKQSKNVKQDSKKKSKMKKSLLSISSKKVCDTSMSEVDSKTNSDLPHKAFLHQLTRNSSSASRCSSSAQMSDASCNSGNLSCHSTEIPKRLKKDLLTTNRKCDVTITSPNATNIWETIDDNCRVNVGGNIVKPQLNVKSSTSNSVGTSVSFGDSSGYGSFVRDPEYCSFSSSHDSEMDEAANGGLTKMKMQGKISVIVENFTQEDVHRYESRSRMARS